MCATLKFIPSPPPLLLSSPSFSLLLLLSKRERERETCVGRSLFPPLPSPFPPPLSPHQPPPPVVSTQELFFRVALVGKHWRSTPWLVLTAQEPPAGGGSDGCVRCFGTNVRPSRWRSQRPCTRDRRLRAQLVGAPTCSRNMQRSRRLLHTPLPHGFFIGGQEEGGGGKGGERGFSFGVFFFFVERWRSAHG